MITLGQSAGNPLDFSLQLTHNAVVPYVLPRAAHFARREIGVNSRKGSTMGLDFAIDELYATGWSELDTSNCEFHADGRSMPTLSRVQKCFEDAGFVLTVRHIQLFDCFRAEWRDSAGVGGAVVGQSEREAAVYALSQMRRQLAQLTS